MNKTLTQYITKDLGYVSKWWKYALIAILVIDAVIVTTLAGCYDGMGDLNEFYFKFNNRVFYVGFME